MTGAIVAPFARWVVWYEPIRQWLLRYYDSRTADLGWRRRHPVDHEYGIRTSGMIPGYVLQRGSQTPDTLYAGSQPSIVRHALALVAEPEKTTLLDLGCGKGRVLAVASEFAFREVIGVEQSETLAEMAEANMAIVRATFPERCPIRVITGDAIDYPLPQAPLAIFLFNPFGAARIARLVKHIEAAIEQRHAAITIVYDNPVWGVLFDASPCLVRRHAVSVPYDDSEMGFGPDVSDTVVIWQDRHQANSEPSIEAQRELVVTRVDERVELAPGGPTSEGYLASAGMRRYEWVGEGAPSKSFSSQ